MTEISNEARLENALLSFTVKKFMELSIPLKCLIGQALQSSDDDLSASAISALLEYQLATHEEEFRKFAEENFPGLSFFRVRPSAAIWDRRWRLARDYFRENLDCRVEQGKIIAGIDPPRPEWIDEYLLREG